MHISGQGLFRLPEATGAQRSVIGVRFNIFEAKESDATIPAPKKKKKSVRLLCTISIVKQKNEPGSAIK